MSEPGETTRHPWLHLCAAIDGFRRIHDGWPSRVRLPEHELRELRDRLLREESFARVEEKVALEGHLADEVVAEDAEGRSYRCGEGERPVEPPASIDAEEWLGVRPDRPFRSSPA